MIDDKKFNKLIDAINKTAPGNGGMFRATREVRDSVLLNTEAMKDSTEKLTASISDLTKVLAESAKSTEIHSKTNIWLTVVMVITSVVIAGATVVTIFK